VDREISFAEEVAEQRESEDPITCHCLPNLASSHPSPKVDMSYESDGQTMTDGLISTAETIWCDLGRLASFASEKVNASDVLKTTRVSRLRLRSLCENHRGM
jgi:hypothetical protein